VPPSFFETNSVPRAEKGWEPLALIVSHRRSSASPRPRSSPSAAYCNQILYWTGPIIYLYSTQKSVNWINRLLLSILCWFKAILLSGRHRNFEVNSTIPNRKKKIFFFLDWEGDFLGSRLIIIFILLRPRPFFMNWKN